MSGRLPQAELIIVGHIATLAGASGYGWQPAMAVGGGRVIAVGPESELETLAGNATERWRLADDLMVMPGITDAHLHLMSLVLAESQVDLTGLDLGASLDAVAERHRQMSHAGDDAGWLLGHGWSMHDLSGWPTADDLERVAPGRPVALYAHDHHSRWISTAALERARIDEVAEPSVRLLIRRDERGRPTGILHEWAATLVDHAMGEPDWDDVGRTLQVVAARLAGLGLTGCHDPGELNADTQICRGPLFYRAMAEAGTLPMRVHSSIRAHQLDRATELGLRSGESLGRYTMGWLKLFADGSLGSRSAALLEPYSDAETNPPTGGPTGTVLTDSDELDYLIRRAHAAGIVGQVHAIGDGAVRMALDALANLPAAERGPQRRVEHAQLVQPADQPRFGALGIAASVQPVHLRSDAPQVRAGWGDRGEHSFPLRGLLDGGALIPFGTDAPVEPPDPWPGIAVAVARRDPMRPGDDPVGAGHAISLERALRAACVDPAAVAGLSDVGRLVPGCRADLLVVPRSLVKGPFDAAAVASTRPLATLTDGQPTHLASGFDPRAAALR